MSNLIFSGLNWIRKDGAGRGPGPNNWLPANATLDDSGNVVLKITTDPQGNWYCAEISTVLPLGFGTFSFNLNGAIDTLDPNVVLGMFCYGNTDSFNEIDIEVARFDSTKNLYFSVYPDTNSPTKQYQSKAFAFSLPDGTYSQHQFDWNANRIVFSSDYGHPSINKGRMATWTVPIDTSFTVPQTPLYLHINLWLRGGQPPTNGQTVQVIINSITHP